jgi:ribose 5-phosphate isomerase B
MKIAIGGDHAGYSYKATIIKLLEDKGITVINFGADTKDSVDYPDHVHPVAKAVMNGPANFGVVICGSGNGVAMTVNKHQNIRAAVCWNVELAKLARQHNNANVISIPARFVDERLALDMVEAFLGTEFEGGRHARRVNKIPC